MSQGPIRVSNRPREPDVRQADNCTVVPVPEISDSPEVSVAGSGATSPTLLEMASPSPGMVGEASCVAISHAAKEFLKKRMGRFGSSFQEPPSWNMLWLATKSRQPGVGTVLALVAWSSGRKLTA